MLKVPRSLFHRVLQEFPRSAERIRVTNPATRDWTVTASLFATLNDMYGNRTVCGIGRGDSAVRVLNGKPTTLATLRESGCQPEDLEIGRADLEDVFLEVIGRAGRQAPP